LSVVGEAFFDLAIIQEGEDELDQRIIARRRFHIQ
jgi:hypothetical protein